MSRTNIFVGLAVLAPVGVPAYLWQQLQNERELRQASVAHIAELEDRLQQLAVDSETSTCLRAPVKPEWVLVQEEEERRRNEEITKLLGEAKFELFTDYMASVEARRLMRQLQGMVAGTQDALAEEQFLPLVKSVAEGQQRYVAERGKYDSPTGLEQLSRYHERMREAAHPYLSPGQFEHFSLYLDQQFEAAQERSNLRRSQAKMQ